MIVAMFYVTVVLNTSIAQTQSPNLLCNGGFEEIGPVQLPPGQFGPVQPCTLGWVSVPCWFSIALTDSGLTRGTVCDGVYAAFSFNGDVYTYGRTNAACSQTTPYLIQSNDVFTVSLLSGYNSTFNQDWENADSTLHVTLYYGGTPTSVGTPFYQGYFDLGTGDSDPVSGSCSAYTNSNIAAPAAAVGQTVGISLYNSSGLGIDPYVGTQAGTNTSWVVFDDVALTVLVPAVLTNQWDGTNLVLSWSQGTLLEATSPLGPWTTNGSCSPCAITPEAPAKFYRLQVR